ncbi:MAG: TadE/TadG family type IV pilus assembly protein [Maritimibacter sp.]
MKHVSTFAKYLGRKLRREDGNASVEFVILFPAIMTIFFSSFEVSIYLLRATMLERALDLNVRELRLGRLDPATPEQLKKQVCDDTLIFRDCPNAIAIELTTISTNTWELPAESMVCVDRREEIAPAVTVDFGQVNDLMMVRACAVLDPFFGTTSLVMDLPLDPSGGYVVAAASTFVNEP